MDPRITAQHYDLIASWWLEQMKGSSYGLSALERALKIAPATGHALEVGCGCEGRYLRVLLERGYQCTALDISSRMIENAKHRFPHVEFITHDITSWEFPKKYDLITAWDSTFHLPLKSQEPVLRKLCHGLSPQGVLLFTCGGGDYPGEIEGEFGDQKFYYSTLGIPKFTQLLLEEGCSLKHIEYDQLPQNHVVVIASRIAAR